MRALRVYVDTSVIGGCFDVEFAVPSQKLMRMVERGEIRLLISSHLIEELIDAPEAVQRVIERLPNEYLDRIPVTEDAIKLQEQYLFAGIVGPSSADDALHVALATVASADLIVSWNFRHIVHYDKIRRFNAINSFNGYPQIDIRSPWEVVSND